MCRDCSECVCGKRFTNNCAHFLSNYMIKNGVMGAYPSGSNYNCTSGRPGRAKDIRIIFRNLGMSLHYNPSGWNSYIYCDKTDSPRRGKCHVYYGKRNSCVHGTGSADYFGYAHVEYYYTDKKTSRQCQPAELCPVQ